MDRRDQKRRTLRLGVIKGGPPVSLDPGVCPRCGKAPKTTVTLGGETRDLWCGACALYDCDTCGKKTLRHRRQERFCRNQGRCRSEFHSDRRRAPASKIHKALRLLRDVLETLEG